MGHASANAGIQNKLLYLAIGTIVDRMLCVSRLHRFQHDGTRINIVVAHHPHLQRAEFSIIMPLRTDGSR